jgi:hypothetical protein
MSAATQSRRELRWIDRAWVTWFIVGSVSFWLILIFLIAMKLKS